MRYLRLLLIYILAVCSALPVLWMFGTAFKAPGEAIAHPAALFPQDWSLAAFEQVMDDGLAHLVGNTLLISLSATLLALSMGFLASYALVRAKFPMRLDKLFLLGVLVIKMLPPIVVAVPLFSLMNHAGLLNTRFGLVISYQLYALPFCVWMLLGFIRNVSHEIEEAAFMDGCGLWRRLWYIVLPLSAPGLVATGIFTLILCWNEFLFALLFLTTPDKFTLPLYIANFMTENGTSWQALMAIGLISSLPMLMLAGYLQKYLLQGFSGGIKG